MSKSTISNKSQTDWERLLSTGALAREYGFTDIDGAQRMWYVGEGTFRKGNWFGPSVGISVC